MSKKDDDLEVLKLIWAEQVRYLDRSDRNWDQLRARARVLVFTTFAYAGVFLTKKNNPISGDLDLALSVIVATLLTLNVVALMIIERPQVAGNNEIVWSNYQDADGNFISLGRKELNKLTKTCKSARDNYDKYQKPFFALYYAMMFTALVSVVLTTVVGIN